MTRIEQIGQRLRDGSPLDDSERELAARIVFAAGQAFYDKSGAMFICGVGGDVGEDGLPDTVFVCPSYGADHSAAFRRVTLPASK